MTTLKLSFFRRRFLLALVLLLVARVTNAATVLYPFLGADNSQAREPFGLDDIDLFTCRYQQIYDASRFAAVLPSGGVITQMYFSVDNELPHFFRTDFPDIQIDFSVTTRGVDQLSTNFSENLGTNAVTVIPRGRLAMGTTGGNPIVVNLTVPFSYDPAEGNLLLDIRKFSRIPPGDPFDNNPGFFEAQDTLGDSVSRVYSHDVNSAAGVADTIGLLTIFKAIPPPIPRLRVRIQGGYLWLRWFRVPRDYTLEQSSILGPDASWQPTDGLVGNYEDSIEVRVPLFPPDAGRFFRLISTNHPSASAPAGLITNQPALSDQTD